MIKKILVVAVVLLCSCSRSANSENIYQDAERHAVKLRNHFMGRNATMDLSNLIAETRSISLRLKRAGYTKSANQFDSYTDVLMYGNNTIDESINDVMELVKHGYCPKEGLFDTVKSLLGCR